MSGKQLLDGILRGFRRLLATGVCSGCGSESSGPLALCQSCRNQLPRIENPCHYCGQPNPLEGIVCPSCRLHPPLWQSLYAPLHYRGLTRDCLLQLKHSGATHLAQSLCDHLLPTLRQRLPRPEVLLPVPLHRARLLERGFNQAREIALAWSARLEVPVDQRALIRCRPTTAQAGLSRKQRRKNLSCAFHYAPSNAYRHVAIVDDIVTTGSTATEITRLLHRQGVEHVEVWALARTWHR